MGTATLRAGILSSSLLVAGCFAPLVAQTEPGTVDVGETGWAVKRPVVASACPFGCPWGELGEFVRDAMAPFGYEVILCRNCNRNRGPGLVSTAGTPPALDGLDATIGTNTRFDAPVDFGITASGLLGRAYHEDGMDNLRLVAKIEDPTFLLVAVRSETGITDLAQIREKKMAVRVLAGGLADRVLDHYRISRAQIEAWGGQVNRAMGARQNAEFDLMIGDHGTPFMNPEGSHWQILSQLHDLRFLDLPGDLVDELGELRGYEVVNTKWGLLRGMDRPIRTVARSGEVIFARADTPDQAAYDIARAVDEARRDLIFLIRRYSIDPRTVAADQGVPLHRGAARFYREVGYIQRGVEMGKGGISLGMKKPRVEPVEESEWTEVERTLLGPIQEERGSVPNIYRTFARHPEIFTPRLNFGRHLQRGSTLPARDREILINRIAWLSNAEYEWSAHTRLGREAGLSEDDLERVALGPDAPNGDEWDRTLLQAVDELFLETMISETTWQALSERYDTHQRMDLVMTVGGYHMLAMALNSFGVQLEDGASGFPPVGKRQPAVPSLRPGTPTRLSEPRIRPVSADNWSDEQRELLEPILESRGYIPNVYGTLANHPAMYRLWIDFAGQILRRSSLPGREREMLINRIAWLVSGEYEWAAHNPIGRREGLTDPELAGLATGPEDPIWKPEDRTLLRAVDELHRHCFIEDQTWESLAGRYDDRQRIDLVLTVGAYKMLAMALNSFGAQLQDDMVGFGRTSGRVSPR